MINHKSDSGSWFPKLDMEYMRADQEILAGAEAFTSYGDKSNVELFTYYGFADQVNQIKHTFLSVNEIEFYSRLFIFPTWKHYKIQSIVEDEVPISLEPKHISTFDTICRILVVQTNVDGADYTSPLPMCADHITTLEMAVKIIKGKLSDFPTTLKDDQKILLDKKSKGVKDHRYLDALILRSEEKKILSQCA